MPNISVIAFCCVLIFQSVSIFICNTFTAFVFWIHRKKLKPVSFLLINLAVADLLVGLTDKVVVGTFDPPRQRKVNEIVMESISTSFAATFSGGCIHAFSCAYLLERALALIWPLRHRITSVRIYIYSVIVVWLARITLATMNLLAVYGSYKFVARLS